MSTENAKALLEKLKTDKALTERLNAVGMDCFEKATADAGHPCTVAHVTEALIRSGELSDEQLSAVVGGSGGIESRELVIKTEITSDPSSSDDLSNNNLEDLKSKIIKECLKD